MVKPLTDLELVEKIKAGDPSSFNQLFERYIPILIPFVNRKLGDKELSLDLLQSVYADQWENRADINFRGEYIGYIFKVVRNRILDHYKRVKVSQRYLDSFQVYIDDTIENTDHLVRSNDLSELIEKEIAALPDSLRLVFELSRNTHLTRKEIAAQLNLTEEGVKTRMHRALKILKKRLGYGVNFI